MRRARFVVGMLALALAMPACGAIVVDPSDPAGEGSNGETGNEDTSSSSTGGGTTADSGPSAVAMRFSQWTPPTDPGEGGLLFDLSIMGTPQPDSLVLFFASQAQACAQPFIDIGYPSQDPLACAAQHFWQAIVILPPERVQVGVIDLNDPSIYVYRAVWMVTCGGGSANTPGVPGSLTISSIDASSIVTKLDFAPGFDFGTSNGDYTATVCP